jgi:hypothetical protein
MRTHKEALEFIASDFLEQNAADLIKDAKENGWDKIEEGK